MADLFAAIDVASVGTAVASVGLAIVGYSLVTKGITISKRLISKA